MKIIIPLCLLLLGGCASIGVTQINPGDPKADSCDLGIFTSKEEVGQQYKIACLIDSRTGSTAFHIRNAAAAIKQSRPYACRCGADALLIIGADTEGLTFSRWGQGKAILQAIRYTASGSTRVRITDGDEAAPWRQKQPWLQLKKGMTRIEVLEVLGNARLYAGRVQYYPDLSGGVVVFDGAGKVKSWTLPPWAK